MVWENNVGVIVMLTNIIEGSSVKAHTYWPNKLNTTISYGRYEVTLVHVKNLCGTVVRKFTISQQEEDFSPVKRELIQLHFTEWNDMGVPVSFDGTLQLCSIFHHYLSVCASKGLNGPAIVHCSAGIGRAGTFIAIATGMKLIEAKKEFDIFELVKHLKMQRPGMVQTLNQYSFIHEAIDVFSRKRLLEDSSRKVLKSSMDSFPFAYEDSTGVKSVSGGILTSYV